MRRWRRSTRRVLRWILPPRPGAVVLGYHRIADPAGAPGGDPYRMCVSPGAFRAQIRQLRDIGHPVSLDHLVGSLEAGAPVRGMIAVTFDDAYESVLSEGLPALEEFGIPATVFVVTGNAGRPYWWDRLTAALGEADPALPFRVVMGTSEFVWPGVGAFEELRVRLHRALRILPAADRDAAVARLESTWLATAPAAVPRALTMEEMGGLASSAHISVGAHSVSHPPLAEVAPRRAAEEILGARSALESGLGREVRAFSYPHGSVNPATESLVREAGYSYACASRQDSLRPGTRPYSLPRVWVTDRAGGAFRRRVSRYLGSRGRKSGTGP